MLGTYIDKIFSKSLKLGLIFWHLARVNGHLLLFYEGAQYGLYVVEVTVFDAGEFDNSATKGYLIKNTNLELVIFVKIHCPWKGRNMI